MLLEVGETDGLADVELKAVGAPVHEYVLPVTDPAPIEIGTPEQLLLFAITAAAGSAFTVTLIELDFTQWFVFVSVIV